MPGCKSRRKRHRAPMPSTRYVEYASWTASFFSRVGMVDDHGIKGGETGERRFGHG